MIIIKLQGGLGNQMFQYAFGKSLAIKRKDALYLDIGFLRNTPAGVTKRNYQLDCFCINNKFAPKKTAEKLSHFSKTKYLLNKYLKLPVNIYSSAYIRESNPGIINKLNINDDVYLDGYWQSENYFSKYKNAIRKDFSFKKRVSLKATTFLKQINNCNSISMHVRRGDYVSNKKINKFHGLPGLDYYKKAYKLIINKIKKPVFFIFSDDIEWCKKKLIFIQNAVFVDGNKDYEDMMLMGKCKHNIIANSSFSWWGAWLNNNKTKIVIAPKKWFADKKDIKKDLLPKTWIQI